MPSMEFEPTIFIKRLDSGGFIDVEYITLKGIPMKSNSPGQLTGVHGSIEEAQKALAAVFGPIEWADPKKGIEPDVVKMGKQLKID